MILEPIRKLDRALRTALLGPFTFIADRQTVFTFSRTSRFFYEPNVEVVHCELLGHIWATTAREYGVKPAISSQLRAFRINTGHAFDMPGSHEVEGSNPSRSTIQVLPVQCHAIFHSRLNC